MDGQRLVVLKKTTLSGNRDNAGETLRQEIEHAADSTVRFHCLWAINQMGSEPTAPGKLTLSSCGFGSPRNVGANPSPHPLHSNCQHKTWSSVR